MPLLGLLFLVVADVLRLHGDFALVVLAIPVGLAIADLLSGLVHWFCDTFLSERAPILGPSFIAPFREHHRDPAAILGHDFFERNASNAIAALPIAAIGCTPDAPPFIVMLALTSSLAVFATNQIHAWAHASAVPGFVRWLQARRLVLSPRAHAVHHENGGVAAYCVTTGWMNALLDRTGILRSAASLLTRAGVPRGTP